jgi:hypothetical protein
MEFSPSAAEQRNVVFLFDTNGGTERAAQNGSCQEEAVGDPSEWKNELTRNQIPSEVFCEQHSELIYARLSRIPIAGYFKTFSNLRGNSPRRNV